MALPLTGAITAMMINLELGRASNAAFNLNDAAVRALAGKPTGAISYADFYGKSSVITVVIAANVNAINLKNYFSAADWTSETAKRVVINSGVEIGATGSYALAISTTADGQAGSFGGELTLENKGIISGKGGAANSGVGGDAILANWPGKNGQKMIIINNGTIRAGGGGGGVGGRGGAGGNGNYSVYTREPTSGQHFTINHNMFGKHESRGGSSQDPELFTRYKVVYAGVQIGYSTNPIGNPFNNGDGWVYWQSGLFTTPRPTGWSGNYTTGGIARDRTDWYNSGGGAGGWGGAGGRGQGYGQTATAGNGGTEGTGPTGANGGWGNWGGAGGTGGDWGVGGARGATGLTGANGNVSAGIAGDGGSWGGEAGFYCTNNANVTWVVTGTRQGRVA